MNIRAYLSCLKKLVISNFNLFTNNTNLFDNFFPDRDRTVKRKVQKLFFRSGKISESDISYFFGYSYEVNIFSNEISFATQLNNNTFFTVIGNSGYDGTFSCFAICSFCRKFLSFFTETFDGFFKISLCFSESLLAIHHTCTGHIS